MSLSPRTRHSSHHSYPKAKKSLGQNFLPSPQINGKIASTLSSHNHGTILEIGSGTGTLTKELLTHHNTSVVAIEPDVRLWPYLLDLRYRHQSRLTLIHGSGLDFSLHHLTQPILIYGNLPFYVASALLVYWLLLNPQPHEHTNNKTHHDSSKDSPMLFHEMALMFQYEVAQRLIASVGSSAYGRLSVLTQCLTQPTMAHIIPASAFRPAPKIDGAVVKFTCHGHSLAWIYREALGKITGYAFNQRRKTLRNSLKRLLGDDVEGMLIAHDINPQSRAQDVSPEQYANLAITLTDQSDQKSLWRDAQAHDRV